MFVRDQWVKKTEFQPEKNQEVLALVLARTQEVLKRGKLPIIIFDLDSTLFDVSKRSYEILREWLAHPDHQAFSETLAQLQGLELTEMRYSLEDVWSSRKIKHEESPYSHHLKHAKSYWRKRFFSNDYVNHDEPTPGAVSFVRRLHEMGAKIVYLTGRDVPLMAFGTFDQLKKHGLPIEMERTRLILKPKRHLDDLEFKAQAAKTIQEWGEVVASFENEPKNLVAMANVFGEKVMNIFIHTVSSDHPAPAGKSVYRIDRFE